MTYAYVQNGEVKESNRLLPKNWANISNFDLLDNETLKGFGWYEYSFQPAIVPDGHRIDGRYFEITENAVIEHENVRPITEQEIADEINSLWKNIRSKRNIQLLESDWTQVLDSPLNEEKKQEWQVYRQSLRDITTQPDPFNITWPTPPEN